MRLLEQNFSEEEYQRLLSSKDASLYLEGSNGFSFRFDTSRASISEGDHLTQYIAKNLIQSLETDSANRSDAIYLSKYFNVISTMTSFAAVVEEFHSELLPAERMKEPDAYESMIETEAKMSELSEHENLEKIFEGLNSADFSLECLRACKYKREFCKYCFAFTRKCEC